MKILLAPFLLLVVGCNFGHGPFRTDVRFEPIVKDCTAVQYADSNGERPPQRSSSVVERLADSEKTSTKLAINQDICTKDGNLLSFAVVEFKDNGTYSKPQQLQNVIDEIKRISRAQLLDRNSNRGEAILLTLYIHGWRHNASENSGDLRNFRSFAHDLANSASVCNINAQGDEGEPRREHVCQRKDKPHVLAVYFGWRGDPTGVAGGPFSSSRFRHAIQLPTFWNRKQAAREIASVAMTEAILTILACVDDADRWRHDLARGVTVEQPPCTPKAKIKEEKIEFLKETSDRAVGSFPKSRKILIGHSFGARALELAVAQAYLGDRAQSLQLYRRQVGEDGAKTLELEGIRKRIDTIENVIEGTQAHIKRMRDKRQGLYGTIKTLRRERGVQLELQKESKGRLSSTQAMLGNWSYSHENRQAMLQRCERYDRDWIERCANEKDDRRGPKELQRIVCVADQLQCINDTYSCAIEEAFSESDKQVDTFDLQTTLACRTLEDVPPNRPCHRVDLGGIAAVVSRTLEGAYEESNSAGVMDVAEDWVDLYCWLQRRPGHTLLKTITKLMHERPEDASGTNGSRMDGERVSLAIWSLEQVIELVFDWVSGSSHMSVREVEEELADQMDRAEEHLTDLVGAARMQLDSVRQELELETHKLRDINARLDAIRSEIKLRSADVDRVESLLCDLEMEMANWQTELTKLEHRKRRLEAEIWYDMDEYLRAPADLVLLMNPATEAIVSLDLLNAMSGYDVAEEMKVTVPPAIVSMTSEGDWATRVLFPAGSWLGRMARLGPRAKPGEWGIEYGTLGHQSNHVTHKIKLIKGRIDSEIDVPKLSVGCYKYVVEGVQSKGEKEPKLGDYWVVSVPQQVIENHDHIFLADQHGDGCADPPYSITKPLLGIVEGLIEYGELFRPLCDLEDDAKTVCGPRKRSNRER